MFTNNYLLFRRYLFEGYNSALVYTAADGNERTVTFANHQFSDIGYCMRSAQCRNIATASYKYSGIYFGTGTTQPKLSDIALETPITSGLEINSGGKVLFSYDGNGIGTATVTHQLKNTTDTEIVIREIGCFASFGQDTAMPVLLERTVLGEPITIPSGVTKIITYQVTFNHG